MYIVYKRRISYLPIDKLTCPSVLWFQKFKFQHKKKTNKIKWDIFYNTWIYYDTSTENEKQFSISGIDFIPMNSIVWLLCMYQYL